MEKAYIAGIIDGEGLIGLYFIHSLRDLSLLPMVAATNTKRILIEYLHDKLGGTVGNQPARKNRSPVFIWTANKNSDIATILDSVLPYLLVKKEQAKLLLQYVTNHLAREVPKRTSIPQTELETYIRLRHLNHRGIKPLTIQELLPARLRN